MKNQYDIFIVRRATDKVKPLVDLEQFSVGYFEYFVKSYDFILLIPFRLQRSKKNVLRCKKNFLHQILCAVLSLSGLASTISDLLGIIYVNMYKQPTTLFRVPVYVAEVLYTFVFFNVFWRKSDEILHFAKLSASNFLSQSKLLYAAITFYPLFLNVLLTDQFMDYVSFSAQAQWYMLLLHVVRVTGFLMNVLLSNFVDTYITVLALTAYNMVRRSIVALENLKEQKAAAKQWTLGDFSSLTDFAQKLQEFFASLNSLGASIILPWFCMFIPWVSNRFVDALPGAGAVIVGQSALKTLTQNILNEYVIGQMYYWAYLGLYLVILVLFAEVKRECDNIKRTMKKIILQYDPSLISGNAALVHIELALKNVGVDGGHFFKFSYGFLGSAVGLVVAYTFLSLQLQPMKQDNDVRMY